MKKKVFIVIKDCAYDYEAVLKVEPFGNLNEALSLFNSLVEECKSEAQEDEWEIEEDTPYHFSAYESGYAPQNHAYITLQISEIEIK